MWKLEGEYSDEGAGVVDNMWSPAIMIFNLACVRNSTVVSSFKRQRPTVDIWRRRTW